MNELRESLGLEGDANPASLNDEQRQLLERGLAELPESSRLAAALARLLAACPDPLLRDGEQATRLALQLVAAEKSLENAETLAMALAESGRLEQAIEWQREVIRQAEAALAGPDSLARLQAQLERYEQGLSCCAPP